MPRVVVDKKFKKRLEAKPAKMRAAIHECIERLADDPTHPSLRTHPVQSQPGVYSARIDRANRLTYERDGDTLVLRNHCNHDQLYRRP